MNVMQWLISLVILPLVLFFTLHAAYAGIQCYDCHGTRNPVDFRPLDAPYRNISTGAFQGNHRSHMGATINASVCAKCHPGSDSFTVNHRNGAIKLSSSINSSPLQTLYRNSTSAFPQTPTPILGSCANVNCHFETLTPTWGSDPALTTCSSCHGAPPAGWGPGYGGGKAGSHQAHDKYYGGQSNCVKCHADHLAEGDGKFAHATSAGARSLVVQPRDPLNTPFGAYTAPSLTNYLPSQVAGHTFGSCKNTYCHSTVQADGGVAPPVYGAPTWGTTLPSCNNTCHGVGTHTDAGTPITTGSHTRHMAYAFNEAPMLVMNCTTCHLWRSTPSTGCIACHPAGGFAPEIYTKHVNGVIDVTFNPTFTAGTYNGSPTPRSGYSTCSNTYCHSNGTSIATGSIPANTTVNWGTPGPLACIACHASPPDYANNSPKTNSHVKHSGYTCNKCHFTTTNDGVTISSLTTHVNKTYDVVPAPGVSFTYAFAATGGTCNNISCHHGGNAAWGTILSCDSCHGAPPATASHLKHYGGAVSQAGYGDVRIAGDFTPNAAAYIMNCGNCHPMDASKHANGTVEVELYNPLAPAGSLKARNPASAVYANGTTVHTDSRGFTYTNGTCGNIYCHSYTDWTTPGGVPQSADCSSYWPPNLVITRNYKTVTWGGPSLGCTGCHANPPITAYPANDGGAGNSHAWIDQYGYENLHNYNMSFHPVSCSYCHNDTVKQLNTWRRDAMGVSTLSDVPISNYSRHVNGAYDVSFDRVTQMVYSSSGGNVSMGLGNAAYEASTKTCSNVSCHLGQTSVKWGTPYRWYYTYECDRCHKKTGCP